MSIGSKRIVQIALVVRDIESATKRWADLLGIEPFQQFQVPTWPEAPTYTSGMPSDASDIKAVKFLLADNLMLALFQPGEKPTPWKQHLDKHGESVFFLELQPSEQEEAMQTLKEVCGTEEPYHIEYQKGVAYALMNTRSSLGIDLNLILPQEDSELIEKINAAPQVFAKLPKQNGGEKIFSRKSKLSTLMENEQATAILNKYLPELFFSGRAALAGMLDLETICSFSTPPMPAETLEALEKDLQKIEK